MKLPSPSGSTNCLVVGLLLLLRLVFGRELQQQEEVVGELLGFQLVNSETDLSVTDDLITNATVISLVDIGLSSPTFNVKVITAGNTTGTIGSVKFGYGDNANYRIDNWPPYALCANPKGNYSNCDVLGILGQKHTITATPYLNDNAGLFAGSPITVTFSIIAGAVAAPSLTMLPTPAAPVAPSPTPTVPPNNTESSANPTTAAPTLLPPVVPTTGEPVLPDPNDAEPDHTKPVQIFIIE